MVTIVNSSKKCLECDVKCGSLVTENMELFLKKLKEINQKRIYEIAGVLSVEIPKELEEIMEKLDNIVIVVTWSDWRCENLPCSSGIELIVFFPWEFSKSKERVLKKIIWEWIINFQKNTLHYKKWVSPSSLIEIKNLLADGKNLFFYWMLKERSYFFPTRFLDSKYLVGNWKVYKNLWKEFLLQLNNPEINKLLKYFKDSRIRGHKKISETGSQIYKWEKIIHFDLNRNEWVIIFEKTPERERWIKMWPLRYFQYKIAYLMLKFLQSFEDLSDDQLKDLIEMDKSISSKFEFLRDYLEWLPKAEWEFKDLIRVYYRFLYLHLLLQRLYKDTEEPILEYTLDCNATKELKEQLNFANNVLKQLKLKSNG